MKLQMTQQLKSNLYILNSTKNKKRVEALKKYVVANVNIVEVYRNEFQAGTRTFVDILDAESELYNSRTSLINIEYTALNNYYDLMFNLSQLTDTVLSSENQICDNVSPRVFSYTPKEQDKQSRFDLDGLISNTDSSIISKELGLDKEIAETASSDAMKMLLLSIKHSQMHQKLLYN